MSDQLAAKLRTRPNGPNGGPSAPPKARARQAFWRMLSQVRPHRRMMIAGVVLGFGVALTYAGTLVGMLPVLKIVIEKEDLHKWLAEQADKAASSGKLLGDQRASALHWASGFFPGGDSPETRMKTLLILLGALVGLNLIGNILRCISQFLVLYATNRTMMDLRRHMYRKALRVPMTALGSDLSNTVSQFMSDTREVFIGISTLFGKVIREPLKAICVLAVALAFDWRLTLIALAIGPPAVALLWYFGRKVRKAMVRLLKGYGQMLGALEETLQGITAVKGYGREGYERRRMWQLERKMLRQQLKLAWIEAISAPLIEIVGLVAACAGIIWLASRTFAHPEQFPASNFALMVGLLAALLDPIRKVANVYNMVQRSGAASDRLFTFLDQPEEHSPPQPKTLVLNGSRRVEFENVTFSYAPHSPPALRNVSLAVAPGECIAIVGPNGSGKSTLLRLLPRLIELQEGGVAVDGTDIRALSLKALRDQIAIVDQRPVIFARSVHENIAYGKPDATREDVIWAAEQAYAAEFIAQLPQGYDTPLGEFGNTLSGGQRQRIAIARAFLKPSRILIFDEATSEIDADSERKIHAALNELRQGKTTFLIAHRHTVMELAERIAVMDAGLLVDVGTHAELLAGCPLYAALYRSPERP
jgi:ATP-binding cassette, subfamily B, bacterial MsbA